MITVITVKADTELQPGENTASPQPATEAEIRRFKKRMLTWRNPVEFVNNMYGCHPGDEGQEYFRDVFGK